MNRGKKNYIVINRWSDKYARYEEYVNHENSNILYICDLSSAGGASTKRAALELVDSTGNVQQVREALASLIKVWGKPHYVVALYEDDQLVAAQLREEFDCPGPRVDYVTPFRDKMFMLKRAHACGVEVPTFREVRSQSDVCRFVARHGLPVILKPRLESSSAGVSKIEKLEDIPGALDNAMRFGDASVIVQMFMDAPIVHVDGIFFDGRITCVKFSDYLGTCLGFRSTSASLGSVERDRTNPQNIDIESFACRVMRALAADWRTTVFHMELFSPTGSGNGWSLLEVGARVGGAMIPYIWREVHEVDLMHVAWNTAVGNSAAGAETSAHSLNNETNYSIGGWLLMQNPVSPPCKVIAITPMVSSPDGPYAELLPPVGTEIRAAHTYFEHIAGRFRFRGNSSAEVAAKIKATAAAFAISVVPV